MGRSGFCSAEMLRRLVMKALFSSLSVEWPTPEKLKCELDREFRFTLDPCPLGCVWDGLALDWSGERVFCNPPYGRKVGSWIQKGLEADVAVFLLPSRTDTKWFHDLVLGQAEVRFIKGRS